jgi:hypothetical protein
VIDGLRVLRGDNDPIVLESVAGEKVRRAGLAAGQAGVSLIHLTLKRPRAKQPSFEAKAILITGAGDSLFKDDPGAYRTGKGLELIPQAAISSLHPGDKLPIVLAMDGEPVAGTLEIVPEAGKSSFLNATAASAAMVPIRKAGRYLVTAHVSGRGCSLVFEVGPDTEAGADTSGRGVLKEKQE